MKRKIFIAVVILGGVIVAGCSSFMVSVDRPEPEKIVNSVFKEGRFQNTDLNYENGIGTLWEITKRYFSAKRNQPVPVKPLEITEMSAVLLSETTDDSIYRLGHSTVLIRLSEQYVLTDPVFSERASPVNWAGPKRFHKSPIAISELPQLTAVIISHDHYDHLDKGSILKLADKVKHFVVPLGVGQRMSKWGIAQEQIIELDWWQSVSIDGLELTATPSQHFSGRGITDKDRTLWASWVIKSYEHNIFFSGDSGYFSGFAEIGRRYGPFDLTMIETGAYNELWSEIHMHPSESVQAHIDLQGKVMMPVHNGTFDLALHDWNEPMQIVSEAADNLNVVLVQPKFGDKVSLGDSNGHSHAWWSDQ